VGVSKPIYNIEESRTWDLLTLQNSPTQLTVNIYRLSVIPTAWYFWHFVYFSSIYSNIQNGKGDLS
jgi:hypothetical protein